MGRGAGSEPWGQAGCRTAAPWGRAEGGQRWAGWARQGPPGRGWGKATRATASRLTSSIVFMAHAAGQKTGLEMYGVISPAYFKRIYV